MCAEQSLPLIYIILILLSWGQKIPYLFPANLIMLKKTPLFKRLVFRTEILPFHIFKSLMVLMQVICVVVLLVGTFDIVLNNIGGSVPGSTGTFPITE